MLQTLVLVAVCVARCLLNEGARRSSEKQTTTPARYDEGKIATNHNATAGKSGYHNTGFGGLGSQSWVPGWELLLRKCVQRAITPDKPSTFDLTQHLRQLFSRQVKRSLLKGASGPDAFKLLLCLISSHFDHGDQNAAMAKLHSFGVATKTPFADCSWVFRLLLASITDSGRVLVPGVEVVLEVVRNSVSEQYPSLMPVLYPEDLATASKPFGSIDDMRLAFSGLSTLTRLPPSTVKNISRFHPLRVFLCTRVQAVAHKTDQPRRSLSKAHWGNLSTLSR